MKANSDYVMAMQSFNDFFEMLFWVLQNSVKPKIELSTSSAFGWRGYQFDEYSNLAPSRYGFQIYYGNPEILLCQESYRDSNNQYFYPFKRKINLQETEFFSFTKQEQIIFLEDFVNYGLAECILWQNSDYRKSKIPPEYRTGKKVTNWRVNAQDFGQVSDKYLLAAPMQEKLFAMLENSLDRMTLLVLSRTNTKEVNTQWRNWAFRGFKMKINEPDGAEPPGRFEYVWRIYFQKPTFIYFEFYDGKSTQKLQPPFEMNSEFLNSAESQQQIAIDNFVKKSLESLLTRFTS